MDTEFQFRKVKNFGIWMMVRVAQYRECTWCHCTGNMVKTVCCTLCDFTTILKYIHTHTHTQHTHTHTHIYKTSVRVLELLVDMNLPTF